MIGDFTRNPRASFPYILASKDGQKIVSPDSLPKGFALSDPDHLKASAVDVLYTHWQRRQAKGIAPLIFLESSPHHGDAMKKSEKARGKKKAEYVHVTDDEDEDGDEDDAVDGDEDIAMEMSSGEGRSALPDEGDEFDQQVISPSAKFGPPSKRGAKKAPASATLPGPPSTIPKAMLKNGPVDGEVIF
jgi:hypothetical protein